MLITVFVWMVKNIYTYKSISTEVTTVALFLNVVFVVLEKFFDFSVVVTRCTGSDTCIIAIFVLKYETFYFY